MSTWTRRRLDELCRVTRGASPRPIIEWIVPEGVPWIKISDASAANSRTITQTVEFIKPDGARHSVRVLPGDLIVSNSATPGIPKFVGMNACIHDGWLLLRDFHGVIPEFLYYRVVLDRVALIQQGNGSVFTNLKTDILKSHVIEVPPIAEQRVIAATLGALDDKIESNRRKLQLLDDVFQATWSKVSSNTRAFRRLGDVVSTQYGLTASASADVDGPRFLRVTDINKANWVSWSSVPSASISEADWRKYRLEMGDLLVARMADPGKSAIYDDESIDAVFASYLVRLKTGSYAESLYLYGFLSSDLYADYAAGATTGSVQKNMNAKVIVDVDVPWPNISEIDSFAHTTAPLRAAINQLLRECDDPRTLRDTLMPELLSGRVRVQGANEAAREVVA